MPEISSCSRNSMSMRRWLRWRMALSRSSALCSSQEPSLSRDFASNLLGELLVTTYRFLSHRACSYSSFPCAQRMSSFLWSYLPRVCTTCWHFSQKPVYFKQSPSSQGLALAASAYLSARCSRLTMTCKSSSTASASRDSSEGGAPVP